VIGFPVLVVIFCQDCIILVKLWPVPVLWSFIRIVLSLSSCGQFLVIRFHQLTGDQGSFAGEKKKNFK